MLSILNNHYQFIYTEAGISVLYWFLSKNFSWNRIQTYGHIILLVTLPLHQHELHRISLNIIIVTRFSRVPFVWIMSPAHIFSERCKSITKHITSIIISLSEFDDNNNVLCIIVRVKYVELAAGYWTWVASTSWPNTSSTKI